MSSCTRLTVLVLSLAALAGCAAGEDGAPPQSFDVSASHATPIDGLSRVAFDRQTGRIDFAYAIGGGCADHHGVASVELVPRDGGLVAKVNVSDVSSAEDFCEALLSIEGSADLGTLIAEASAKSGEKLSGQTIRVELPAAQLQARSGGAAATQPSAPASKEVVTPIESLTSLSLDPASGALAFAYVIGGGCAEHRGAPRVELSKTASGPVARVRMFDVSSAEDPCEALVGVSGSADLQALVAEAAAASGQAVAGQRLVVELPSTTFEVP
jgi:hypothetical protein